MRENYKENCLTLKSGWKPLEKCWSVGMFFQELFLWGGDLGDDAWWIKCLVCKRGDQSWSLAQDLGQMWLPAIPAVGRGRDLDADSYRTREQQLRVQPEAALVKCRGWRAWCQPLSSSHVCTQVCYLNVKMHTHNSVQKIFCWKAGIKCHCQVVILCQNSYAVSLRFFPLKKIA